MSLADLPSLDNEGPVVSPFEFMPAWRFYLPLYSHILRLGITHGGLTTLTAANPAIPGGGFVGEQKSQVMDLVTGTSRKLIAPYARVLRSGEMQTTTIEQAMAGLGLSFPLVAKPDISCRGAGIRIARSIEDVGAYWDVFPDGAHFLLQELVELEPEAGIFYLRDPATDQAEIFSLTLKYTPSVTGDGTSNLRQLVENDARAALTAETYFQKPSIDLARVPDAGERIKLSFAGNHCRGSVFRDGAAFITPELTHAVDEIVRSMPSFHFGRFDVRFENLKQLKQGRGFRIIEINGVGSEATHIWDNRFVLKEARSVLRQQFTHAYDYGSKMVARGNKPLSLHSTITMWWHERQLTKHYPVSE